MHWARGKLESLHHAAESHVAVISTWSQTVTLLILPLLEVSFQLADFSVG